MVTIKHVMPGETGGDTEWFFRQNSFEQDSVRRQVDFKRKSWPDLADGRWNKDPQHVLPYILPGGCELLAFYQPLSIPILNYCSEEDIALHSEIRNLKSSQAACFNFLFPFHQDHKLAQLAFDPFLPRVKKIDKIEFEYTGPPETTDWLGEPLQGKRGSKRTSIDVVLFWSDVDDKRHASLIEWKYCEKNFGTCSTYDRADKANKAKCESIRASSGLDPSQLCLLANKQEDRPRRYWEHLKISGISWKAFEPISGCPFRGPLYQLMRQCEMAAFLKECGLVDYAEVLLLSFSDNTFLLRVPDELVPLGNSLRMNIIAAWNEVLQDVAPIRQITVEQLMDQVDQNQIGDVNWRSYIRVRYGI